MVYLQTWMSVKQRRCVPMVSASTWTALTSACVTLATDSHPISRSVTVRAIRQSCLGLLSFLICKALSIMKIMSGQNKTHQIASKNQIHSSGYAPIFIFFWRGLWKMKLNDSGWQKLEKQISWQQLKHAKLYSDRLQVKAKNKIFLQISSVWPAASKTCVAQNYHLRDPKLCWKNVLGENKLITVKTHLRQSRWEHQNLLF